INLVPIPPNRGLIYDRSGTVLAENIPTFSLDIIPEQVENLEAALDDLAHIVGINEEDLTRFHLQRKRKRRFQKITLKSQLSEDEIARFSVQRHNFPGVDISVSLLRNYPYADLMSHVIGYLGRISEKDLSRIDESAYSGSTHIGKSGLEKSYETDLLGRVGVKQVEINASGRVVRVLATEPAEPGQDLRLYLDVRLQRVAHDALGDNIGTVVAIDPATGGVLALVSKPGYDPNPFVEGISFKDYARLRDDPDVPLFNRVIQGRYPPGSTVKPFIALGGLELGVITARQSTYCPGRFQLKGSKRVFRDWKIQGHGRMDVDSAVTQSCDVFFYDLAVSIGIDRFHDYLRPFGFGRRTGVDLPLETRAVLPSRKWKRGRYGQSWLPGDTVNAGIGQGYFLASPMQLAYATALFAADGRMPAPRLAQWVGDHATITDTDGAHEVRKKAQSNWDHVRKSMRHVVEHGTARRIRNDLYTIAGKTGTAQVVSMKQNEKYDEKKLEKKKHDHALFVAFAPVDNPRIAVSVIVENGGHGGATAAPVARRVMDFYIGGILAIDALKAAEAVPENAPDTHKHPGHAAG
ncbi:MAG: penicillin-binding protein 2, partial [Pseudomonadota bacterium]